MSVEIRNRFVRRAERGTLEIDHNFLGLGVARKVYAVLKEGEPLGQAKPHYHPGGHTLIPIAGRQMWMAYRDEEGTVHRLRMEVGKSYYIPAMVPHQILVREGIVESYFEPGRWVAEETAKELDELFLDAEYLEREAGIKA